MIRQGRVENLTTVRSKHIECIISQEEFECIINFDSPNLVVIAITDPGAEKVDPQYFDGFKKVLEVQFFDTRPPVEDESLVISDDIAKKIRDFILENKNEKFVIFCTAGVGRSAGVGCAIESLLKYTGDKESYVKSHWRYSPNEIVFNRIIN